MEHTETKENLPILVLLEENKKNSSIKYGTWSNFKSYWKWIKSK